ncbi:MAG: zinc-dependent peptidase [Candidatus Bipolaricaulaceae bacterium]
MDGGAGAVARPFLGGRRPWRLLLEEFQNLQMFPRPTPLATGLENPAEFLAVAVELFFADPWSLRIHHPRVYHLLSQYFRLDPAALRRL